MSDLLSCKEYIKKLPCVAVRYFYDGDIEDALCIGPELHLEGSIENLVSQIPSVDDAYDWFMSHDDHICFYVLNKEEINQMIANLEKIRDRMEDDI